MRKHMTPHGSFEGVRGFLSPLSWIGSQLWAAGARMRAQIPYRHVLEIPVISVGNLQVGGTGKTPLALWLLAHLRDHHRRTPVLVSRGYGRRSSGTHMVTATSSVLASGDEPLLVARKGFAVVVGDDRYAAARMAMDACGADVVVLDDGFQQRDLAVDLQLVLWDSGRAGSETCLPYGCLRAPRSCLAQADALILRRDAGDAPAAAPRADVPVFEAGYGPLVLLDPQQRPAPASGPVVLAAGVGNPDRLAQSLVRSGVNVVAVAKLADHCAWDEDDIAGVRRVFVGSGAAAVVITAKDAVKRSNWDTLLGAPVYVAEADFGPCSEADRQTCEKLLERLWRTK